MSATTVRATINGWEIRTPKGKRGPFHVFDPFGGLMVTTDTFDQAEALVKDVTQ